MANTVRAGLTRRELLGRTLAASLLSPYVGFEWTRLPSDTADLARSEGDELGFVAGLRIMYRAQPTSESRRRSPQRALTARARAGERRNSGSPRTYSSAASRASANHRTSRVRSAMRRSGR